MRYDKASDEELARFLDHAFRIGHHDLAAVIRDEYDRRDRYTPPAPEAAASPHQAALWYAAQGLAVFPLRPGTKVPATRNGCHNATIDPDQIDVWWRTDFTYNIGIATGLLVDVADLDGWDGVDTWAQLDERPETLGVVVTPRKGGRHVYVPATGMGNRAHMAPGMDWRGLGGYVVAPPSRTPEGRYWWLRPLRTDLLNPTAKEGAQ
ncbi:MAG: bifunctional DNA primase/polymerase [Propionibacteriaceae bacterium]|nr:bifunctional DNA primase/polymerase [Propionibacteriaceae bacterium]